MNDLISEYQQYEELGVDDDLDQIENSEEYPEFPSDGPARV